MAAVRVDQMGHDGADESDGQHWHGVEIQLHVGRIDRSVQYVVDLDTVSTQHTQVKKSRSVLNLRNTRINMRSRALTVYSDVWKKKL